MKEIWKNISNYNDKYQISNYGRIKSVDSVYMIPNQYKKMHKHIYRGKILKTSIDNNGYANIRLRKNGKTKCFLIHRLVAKAFIPNPNNYPVINHINGNKLDNKVENLEWCTQSHNVKEAYKLGLQKTSHNVFQKGHIPHNITKINQYDLQGNYIKTYNSILEATLLFTNKHSSNISQCLNGKINTAYGYIWRYADK